MTLIDYAKPMPGMGCIALSRVEALNAINLELWDGGECEAWEGLGAGLGEIPEASSGMTGLWARV